MPDDVVRRQHYVPRMYLRHFTTKRGSEQIWAFNKQTATSFLAGLMNVAQQSYFYDFPVREVNDGDLHIEENEQIVEKFFGDIENDATPLFRKVIAPYYMQPAKKLVDFEVFTMEEQARMAAFIALQLMRTPDMRELFTELAEKSMTAFLKTQLPTGTLRGLRVRLGSEAEGHAYMMFNEQTLLKLIEVLLQKAWVVAVNSSPHPFYTSDVPVVCYGHIEKGLLKGGGLGRRGVEITFPLNSDLSLLLRDREYFAESQLYHNRYMRLPPEATEDLNYRQVMASDKMVFCREDSFEQAREFLKDVDALAKGERINALDINKRAKEWFADKPLDET